MSCSRTQHGGGRFRTPDLSLRSPTLYHWATALPHQIIWLQCFKAFYRIHVHNNSISTNDSAWSSVSVHWTDIKNWSRTAQTIEAAVLSHLLKVSYLWYCASSLMLSPWYGCWSRCIREFLLSIIDSRWPLRLFIFAILPSANKHQFFKMVKFKQKLKRTHIL